MDNAKRKTRKTPAGTKPEIDGSDLRITKQTRRSSGPGTWVKGTIHGHRFEALVFPEHAEVADYELGDSRISKLWLQRLADKHEVYCWDRGLDLAPADATAAAVADFLAAGLAEHVFGT
jgi:hypothetical protein